MADAFVIARTTASETYTIWAWEPGAPSGPLVQVSTVSADAKLPTGYEITSVGGYVLLYEPPSSVTFGETAYVNFTLLPFDPGLPDPLNADPTQKGFWYWDKFTGDYSYTDVPNGPQLTDLKLLGVTGYVLSMVPTPGRSTFTLFGLDSYADAPGASRDPIDVAMAGSDAFPSIGPNDTLIPIENYVLVVNRTLQTWRVYSFDPQLADPLSYPQVSEGVLPPGLASILIAVGGNLLAWSPGATSYGVFAFSPTNPFPAASTYLVPAGFPSDATTILAAAQTLTPIGANATTPGTMDFMRSQIKHVVYYVLESRSFDSVVGWLYDASTQGKINWVPPVSGQSFEGASTANSNLDSAGNPWFQNQLQGGVPSTAYSLDTPVIDPFHGTADSIHQQWTGGYPSYRSGAPADMGGFVLSNANSQVMSTYSPLQLAVLNGIASNYAVSDEWFCSEAGGTTANRATLASGSAYDITVSFESGNAYTYFPDTPRRQSMWKVLANHGIMDWAIYYSVLWEDQPYTYHLYLEGQLPSVDEYWQQYIQPINSFFDAAAAGTLPAFSFLEPVWYDPSGTFTSYHPTGDVLPGEQGLLNLFNALLNSPKWNETVLVISFSKGGGMYDHVPARKMTKGWPNDGLDGYAFDTTGARVPTLVVSPLVNPNTVFRSGQTTPYDATSLAATVLSWFGVPRSSWGMGDRVAAAPTFEGVLQLAIPRTDTPALAIAIDQTYPNGTTIDVNAPALQDSAWKTATQSSSWGDYHNWSPEELPTNNAHFGFSYTNTVRFASADPQQVNQVVFDASAQPYTLLFQEATPDSPTLTIAGLGVINNSANPQTFAIAATSIANTQAQLAFLNTACAGDASITYSVGPEDPQTQSGGIVVFNQRSNAGSANFEVGTGPLPPEGFATVGAEVRFLHYSSAAQGTFTVTGTTGSQADTFGNVAFHNCATAGTAVFTNVGGTLGDGGNTQFYEQTSAENATILNQGATQSGGNGGDTAFDGQATAGSAHITNQAATAGNGGVTSFNNNAPYMAPTFGSTAGNATIVNQAAQTAPSGSGGHTEFTGVYGSGNAGQALIDNDGTATANSTGAGYTLFAVNGKWPFYQPSAGRANITNHPGACAGAQPGNTSFTYQNYDNNGDAKAPGPTAGSATITNLGGTASGAPGGITTFDHEATAGSATLIASEGTNGGLAGTLVFSGNADGDQATVQLVGGALSIASSTRAALYLGALEIVAGSTLAFALGPKSTHLVVQNRLSLVGPIDVVFVVGTSPTMAPQLLLVCSELQAGDQSKFVADPIGTYMPAFEVRGNQLWVQFLAMPGGPSVA